MKKLSTDEIRRSFIDFFVERGHTEWPSDSLIPSDDPTLLFTGAGMNQFKDMFLGKGNLPFSRATTAQKCLRTGDLGNVGKTAYHQTFFEMMGNFSFGDYFKKEAIEWAFEWLTEVLEIPPKRLYFSVYEDDDEAYGHWKAVCEAAGLDPERRIFRLDAKENFWPADAPEKGPNGPCGPCSEIFFDQQHDPDDPEPLVDIAQEGSRFCEIWNLVFTQFDRRGVNVLEPLPQKNIDTGLGLERLAAVLQGVERNSDIDIFQPIMRRIESEFADGKHITDMDATSAQCVRRIADHVRSVSFCICDGAMPGNAERGYVVRRLIRRAFLDAAFLRGDYEYAGLSNIVEPVLETMGEAYPDLVKRCEFIREIISGEERDFVRTLNANRNRLNDTLKEAKSRNGVVDGQRAFKLFDTYGVPVEVMEDFFERHGVKLDREGFDAAVTRRREQSRKASKMKGDIFDLGPLGKALEVTTETKFTGYSELEATRLKPLMLFCGDEPVRKVKKGDKVVVVLDRTPFYAEAGGQVGDTGYLRNESVRIRVTNVTRVKKVFFHFGNVVSGSLEGRLGEKFPVFSDLLEGEVDAESRRATERNHTSTHLLHWALREVLGRHCEQSGSLVEPNRLRFDFTHFRQVTPEQLSHIERLVNERIVQDHELRAYTDSLENARKSGVIALFGEKYEDTVRIVDIGGFSKELCGGCHISRTGEIGSLVITGEEAIAAGIRRLTAYTGLGALSYCRENLDFLSDASNLLGEKPERLVTRLETILDENKQLRNELEAVKRQALAEEASDAKPEDIGGVPALVVDLGEAEPSQLRGVMDTLKNRVPGGLMLLAARSKGKVTLLVYVDEPLIKRGFKAGELIRPVAKAVGGGGGGRPNMAQAGGSRPEKLQEAFDVFRKHVEQQAAGS